MKWKVYLNAAIGEAELSIGLNLFLKEASRRYGMRFTVPRL